MVAQYISFMINYKFPAFCLYESLCQNFLHSTLILYIKFGHSIDFLNSWLNMLLDAISMSSHKVTDKSKNHLTVVCHTDNCEISFWRNHVQSWKWWISLLYHCLGDCFKSYNYLHKLRRWSLPSTLNPSNWSM